MGKFEIKEAKTGVKFNLKATNGQVIASSQIYKSRRTCKKGIASVMNNAPDAGLEDQTVEGFEKVKNPKFEVYQDKKGEFRFRLKAMNGDVVFTSDGYSSKASAKNGIESIRKNAEEAKVEVLEK